MEFRDIIKSLRVKYNNALLNYYGRGHLIFKTIYDKWVRGLYDETNLMFRTAGILNLSDKHIESLIKKGKIDTAVEKLKTRIYCCEYLSILMKQVQEKEEFSNPQQLEVIQEFKQIDKTLNLLQAKSQRKLQSLISNHDMQNYCKNNDMQTK